MKIVDGDGGLELHISSSVIDNFVTSHGKRYNYRRLVIPNVIMDYFWDKKPNLEYVFLYFVDAFVFMSVEKIHGLKFSRRKVIRFGKKNSYFITLNEKSFRKHEIVVGSSVLFVVGGVNVLDGSDCVTVELRF